jgi:hypothetical protein
MNSTSPADISDGCVLVEGPPRDAELVAIWLTSAATVDRLLADARSKDSEFAAKTQRLDSCIQLHFGTSAMIFLEELVKHDFTAFIRLGSYEMEPLCMMTYMGFFKKIGRRYELAIPEKLDTNVVREGLLSLARTEDEGCMLHPEHLLCCVSKQEAVGWRLRRMQMREALRFANGPLH